jgi:hypothetical protein
MRLYTFKLIVAFDWQVKKTVTLKEGANSALELFDKYSKMHGIVIEGYSAEILEIRIKL